MKPASSPDAVTRLQTTAAIAVALLSIAWLLYATLRSSDVPFLTGEPAWIMVEAPLDSNAVHVDLDRVPVVRFERRFDVGRAPAAAVLTARALSEAEFFLNGRALDAGDENAGWRQPRRIELEIGRASCRERV